MRNRRMQVLMIALCLLLIGGPLSLLAGGGSASAQVLRVAVVKSLEGTVSVLKSGGTKSFKAFKNMSLNEGDQIATGKDSSVKLELASEDADKDSVTIGASSQVTFTKLKDKSGAKTKMSIWAGSLWLKVKSVSNANDQFEVETPTSIMGVRGTQFMVGVDPLTGLTRIFLASGVVQASTDSNRLNPDEKEIDQTLFIYPSQEIVEARDGNSADNLLTSISTIDIEALVRQISPEIIRQLIADAASIKQENDDFIAAQKKKMESGSTNENDPALGGLNLNDLAKLESVKRNLENLVGLIAQKAIEQNKISITEMEKIIQKVNQDAGKIILDLSKVAPLELDEKQKQQEKEKAALIKKQQELAAAKQKEQDKLNAQKEKLAAAMRALEELNKKKLEEQQKKAEADFLAGLSDEEKKRYEADKKSLQSGEAAQPGTTSPSTGGGDGTVQPSQTGLAFDDPAFAGGTATAGGSSLPLDLAVKLGGFNGSRKIYGYQIEVEYTKSVSSFNSIKFNDANQMLAYRGGNGIFKVEPEGLSVSGADSVDDVRVVAGTGTKSTVIYSVTKFSGSAVQINGNTTVAKLPFLVNRPAGQNGAVTVPVTFHIKSITAVDEQGRTIVTSTGQDLNLNVAFNPLT
ncbi:FecR family protein [Paenibacillus nasutitermitis]|uniref:FecR protein domain-containing protein n=1 Tax=Paenibacillus nasutitermitis TaxID=1652958 RepID=A0A916YPL3_9BACL|nr:FecR family protein [Paenibacillus nasutitermitis]GGD55186.1 hypothetical protein GCM10010911_11070 [Paenibacillus nasutitermitis]